MREVERLFAALLQQDADMQAAGVEINAVAKNKQQQQGNDHRDKPATRVAQDLTRLFHAQRAHAPQFHHWLCSLSQASIRRMKASSIVGSSFASHAAWRFKSSGVPLAISLP